MPRHSKRHPGAPSYEPGTGVGNANVPFYGPGTLESAPRCYYGQVTGSSSIRVMGGSWLGATNTA